MPYPEITPVRQAVYFAPPPGSPWWEAGSSWLGRCAASGQLAVQPPIAALTREEQWSVTAAPRRYGWHATLKAPFRLAAACTLPDLQRALRQLGQNHPVFDLPPLQVVQLDGFLALVPGGANVRLQALADCCVRDLQALAAPLDAVTLARRCPPGTTDDVRARVMAWSYAHVFDHFRFHFTLCGPLTGMPPDKITALRHAAEEHFGDLPVLRAERLWRFEEPSPGGDFLLREGYLLRGSGHADPVA